MQISQKFGPVNSKFPLVIYSKKILPVIMLIVTSEHLFIKTLESFVPFFESFVVKRLLLINHKGPEG